MHAHSRRGFLRLTLGGAWTAGSLLEQGVMRAAQARAQAAAAAPRKLFDLEKVAEGIYAAIARPAAQINCNAAIFVNSADVLIVDTHSKGSAAAALVAQVRREITPKPVRYIVNTHFHWDHVQGNPAYKSIAPRADIIASQTTRSLISEFAAPRLKASVEQAARSLEEYRRKAASEGSAEEKAYWRKMASETQGYIAEMKGWAPELPNVTLSRDLTIHDKAHDLHIAFRGRAHTSGDIVVFCPQKKAIATGDILHGFAPYLLDGYPLEWPRTLIAATEFPFEHVLGGHAGVQHARDRLYQMGTYIEDLADRVSRGRAGGKSVEEIQAEATPGKLKSLGDGYGEYIAGNLLRYTPNPPGTTAADVLRDAVAGNVADIAKVFERG